MKKVIIAFDIDGTLRKNSEERHRTEVEPNERMVSLLEILAHSKNTEIHLWSNRGAIYCQEMRKVLGLEKFVKASHCHLKQWAAIADKLIMEGNPEDVLYPQIAIDDQQRFDGGIVNLIVREK